MKDEGTIREFLRLERDSTFTQKTSIQIPNSVRFFSTEEEQQNTASNFGLDEEFLIH